MAIIVDLPIENGGSFHSYVKLPEGNLQVGDIFPTATTAKSGVK